MGVYFVKTFVYSFLVCILGYVSSQDYYESVTVSTVSYKNPKVIIVGMKGNDMVDNFVEKKRLQTAKNLLNIMRHTQHLRTQDPFLKSIPKTFEVFGSRPEIEFNRYLTEIHQLSERDNVTVFYKIKVELNQVPNKGKKSAAATKRTKSKKYNIPLKKKNMRLSNFEIIMRKLSENNGQQQEINQEKTTEDINLRALSTTTKIPVKKYKPIITRVRPKFAKKESKPVKKHEFILHH